MADFLAGVSGLIAVRSVVVESKNEQGLVLTLLPRGHTEATVLEKERKPGLVIPNHAFEVMRLFIFNLTSPACVF